MALTPRTLHLIDPMGTGDLATVYRATDPEDGDSAVAVAMIHDDLNDVDGVVEALGSRVDAVTDLVHPGVVGQDGLFLVSGRPALVQEIVPGVDLIRLAKVGQVEMGVAVGIIREAAMVLDALAQDGWAHGFLSPRRTLLTISGQVKITGFGAKAGTALVGDALDAVDRGRMRYVAPERGEGILDHPGDVYALGAMLSLLLTGTWPKRPSRDPEEQAGVAKDAANRIIEAGAESADVVAELVEQCMSSKASDRPTLDALGLALEPIAIDAEGLADWASDVVKGVGGAAIDGLEANGTASIAATADDLVVDEASPEDSDEALPEDSDSASESERDVASPVPAIDVEELQPIGPDDETDLAEDIDTDEPEDDGAEAPVIDANADKWDRMLGLDVVPDSAEKAVLSDQVPQKSNIGLWIVLGLVLGCGVAWSMGLFGPAGSETTTPEPPTVTVPDPQPAPPPAVEVPTPPAPPEIPEVVEDIQPPAPEAVPEAAPSVKVPEPVVPPVVAPPPVVVPPDAPVPPPTPAPVEKVPEATQAPAAPQTALIGVAGDAHQVRLVRAGRRYSGGRMPPGAYRIEVIFQAGEKPRVAGRIDLAAGDRKLVRCAAAFYRCQVH